MRRGYLSPFIISVTAIIGVTALIIISAVSCSNSSVTFKAEYYFVCYSVEDNSISASSISGAVSNYGGAGYVLEHKGSFYVTVACYYNETDAKRVRFQLYGRGLVCEVLKIETDEYLLQSVGARGREKLYAGNLTTLNSLSLLAYECANGLDTGSYSQSGAKSVIADVKSGLTGLKNANMDNCFTGELTRLISECDAFDNYIYSKDMRKLQIAIIDTIINIRLY